MKLPKGMKPLKSDDMESENVGSFIKLSPDERET